MDGTQQFTHDDYTVGWICALPKTELVAATAMLDERHPILPAADLQDTNVYIFGRIGTHNVVIACLPAETTGKVSAATVAKDLLRSFKRVRFGLMVGVGGGAPYYKDTNNDAENCGSEDEDSEVDDSEDIQDIRLGDVVISLHSKSTEAVVQFDFGKSVQGQDFVHTGGQLNKPPQIVLKAISVLQAEYVLNGHKIFTFLSEMLSKNPGMRAKFQHPGSERDRLFKSHVVHVEGKKSCKACCGPDDINLVKRRERFDTCPRLHYGTIGSADQVMKDATLRDKWAREEGIMCFEMEAAGLMDSFPCLIIRGICDYADSHKSKTWQPYAAATAAAYARELLSVIPGHNVIDLPLINQSHIVNELKSLNQGLEKVLVQQRSQYHAQMTRTFTKEQQKCHQIFKTSTYEQHKNINPERVEGTCEWVYKNPQYIHWLESNHNKLLWVSADPGCGKSVLARSLIDNYLSGSIPASICYFFFKDNDEQNNVATALCAVLHQLFGTQPHLLQYAMPSCNKNGKRLTLEIEELWRIFMAAAASTSSNIICIFDALDECRSDDQHWLIKKFENFSSQQHSSHQKNSLKFLVTSRPYTDIQKAFLPTIKSYPEIHLRGEEENDQIHKEINLVVQKRVAELCDSLCLSREIQQRLEQQLLQMEHRTYLWLYLAIDDIHTTFQNSFRPDEESIRLIPTSVDAAYEKILNRVPLDKVLEVRRILQIIVGARRPLTIPEMAMALGVADRPHERTALKARINPKGLDTKIRHLCGLFVFVSNSKIYLIHQTAREFLLNKGTRQNADGKWSLESSDNETLMSRICVNYLLMNDLEGDKSCRNLNSQDLLKYSTRYWPDHVRNMQNGSESEIQTQLDQLYDTKSTRFAFWYPLFWEALELDYDPPTMNALHLAAFNGHTHMVLKFIIVYGDEIDNGDSTGTNALQWATRWGYSEVVKVLLEHEAEADANAQSIVHGNGNALQMASYEGHKEIAKMLLEYGADVNSQDRAFGTALQTASAGGHKEISKMLLEYGADVDIQEGAYGNPLQMASDGGHKEIVKMLLEYGAYVDVQDGHGNPLQMASAGGYEKIVKMLLEYGADVNVHDGYGTPLEMASAGGHEEIVKMLLEYGADTNARAGPYGNTRQSVSYLRHEEIVKMLLEYGADANAHDGIYGNARDASSDDVFEYYLSSSCLDRSP